MGRLSVRVAERLSDEVHLVSVYVEHANGGSEEPQKLRAGKKSSLLLLSATLEPFLYLTGFAESTLVVEWGGESSHQHRKDFVSLVELPMGEDVRVPVGDGSELVLDVCLFDFGKPAVVVGKSSVFAREELFDNLFCRSVCDVELLELRDLTSESGAGGGGRKLVAQVCFDTSSSVYKTPVVECVTQARLADQDCSFLFGGAVEGEAAEADSDREVLLTVSLFEKRSSKEHLLGSVTVDLQALVHLKQRVEHEDYPHMWLEVKRMQHRVCWLKCRIAVSLENDPNGMLSRFGLATSVLPMRVNYGDIVLMHNSNAVAKIIAAATACFWDHVALVACGPEPQRELRLMEATRDGVLAYEFEARLSAILRTDAVLGVRRLLHVDRNAAFCTTLSTFVEEHHGKQYEESVATLIRAKFKANHEESLSSLFCSELVAAAFQELDVLGRDVISSNFSPKDFAQDRFPLLRGRLDAAKRHALRPSIVDHDIDDVDAKQLRLTVPANSSGNKLRISAPLPGAVTSPSTNRMPSPRVGATPVSPRVQPRTSWRVQSDVLPMGSSEAAARADGTYHPTSQESREWSEVLASPGLSRTESPAGKSEELTSSAEAQLQRKKEIKQPRQQARGTESSSAEPPRNDSWARKMPTPTQSRSPLAGRKIVVAAEPVADHAPLATRQQKLQHEEEDEERPLRRASEGRAAPQPAEKRSPRPFRRESRADVDTDSEESAET